MHAFHHGFRHNAVRLIVGVLNGASALGFVNGAAHGACHGVGIHNDLAVGVAGGAPDGLNQRGLGAKKPFLIRIKNRHQRNLR